MDSKKWSKTPLILSNKVMTKAGVRKKHYKKRKIQM